MVPLKTREWCVIGHMLEDSEWFAENVAVVAQAVTASGECRYRQACRQTRRWRRYRNGMRISAPAATQEVTSTAR